MDNLEQESNELAKKFIDRQLSADELALVEERIATDRAFAENVAFHVAMRDAFAAEEQAKQIPKFSKKQKRRTFLRSVFSLAATFLLLLIFWFFWQSKPQTQIAAVRASNWTTFLSELTPKSTLGGVNQVDQLLLKGDYEKAKQLLLENREQAADPCKNNLINYKLGMYFLYQGNVEDIASAIEPFNCLLTDYADDYPLTSIHLARAYLWTNQTALAKETLSTNSAPLPLDLQKLLD